MLTLPPYCGQFSGYSGADGSPYFSSRIISRFCEDDKGRVWIASDDSGLSCFDPLTKQFINFKGREQLSKKNLHALCTIGDNLWIGAYSSGIQVLNTQNGILKKFDTTNGLDENSIYTIFKDNQGNIWTGSMRGICLYNPEKEEFIKIKDLDALVSKIIEDTSGNLWIATQGKGVLKYSPKQQTWKKYNKEKGLYCPNINHLCINRDNELWVATGEEDVSK